MVGRILGHKQYISAIMKGDLEGLECSDCGKIVATPKQLCPNCQSENLKVVKLSGRGSVAGFTCINVAAPKFEQYVPFALAHIQLEEGAKITARLVDIDAQKVDIGLKVKMSCVKRSPGDIELVFKPE